MEKRRIIKCYDKNDGLIYESKYKNQRNGKGKEYYEGKEYTYNNKLIYERKYYY